MVKLMTLIEAIKEVRAKYGSDLSTRAVVEKYPSWRDYCGGMHGGGIFAYQFMSVRGTNLATFIPDVPFQVTHQQPGGRVYPSALVCQNGTKDISFGFDQ